MKRMNVREFRMNFSKMDEAVEVLKGTQTIGWYYPGMVSPEFGKTLQLEPDMVEGSVFTSPAPITVTDTGGTPKVDFRPVPKPASRKRS